MKRHHTIIRYAVLGALMLSAAGAARAQQASTTYRSTARDPFVAWRPTTKKKPKNVPTLVEPPTIQARIDAYKTQKAAAMNMQLPAPKATAALLLSEVQLTGVFRTPRGYAAMVVATPIKLTFVIYPGEKFFDGMLVAIEENRLVCRKETRWSDGRRELSVAFKPMGQPTPVKNTMSAGAPAAQPKDAAKDKSEPAKTDQSAAVKQ